MMKLLILSGSPKKRGEGLCQSLIARVEQGFLDGGAEVEVLEFSGLARCRVCGDGWGSCRDGHVCAFGDDGFSAVQERLARADGLCLITPVYFGEMSESLKGFTDRLRRCWFSGGHPLRGRPALLVASAGGSGNGLVNCLGQMERFCQHTGLKVFDMVGVNRWDSAWKSTAAYEAARVMARGLKEEGPG